MTVKKRKAAGWVVVAAGGLFALSAGLGPAAAQAPGFALNAALDVKQNLDQALQKKAAVELQLRNGQTLAGSVAEVGDHYVHLTKLAGRDFYDALVRIEDISALIVRASSK